jgi:site-specific DNA-cytosine methylase
MRNNDGWYDQISITLPKDKGLKMRNVMQQMVDKSYFLTKEKIESIKHWRSYQNPLRSILLPQSKSPTLTARGAWEDHSWMILVWDKWRIRKITPLECERLQTLPDNYTAGVDKSQRYKMLWNWWTVDVIAHIFKSILK